MKIYDCARVGNVKQNTAPRGLFLSAQKRPPCSSIMGRQIDRPIPRPLELVPFGSMRGAESRTVTRMRSR